MAMAMKTDDFQGVMDLSLVHREMCCPQLLPEDEGRIFLQKTGTYIPNYAVSHPRKL
jgi:hypothetical protein